MIVRSRAVWHSQAALLVPCVAMARWPRLAHLRRLASIYSKLYGELHGIPTDPSQRHRACGQPRQSPSCGELVKLVSTGWQQPIADALRVVDAGGEDLPLPSTPP